MNLFIYRLSVYMFASSLQSLYAHISFVMAFAFVLYNNVEVMGNMLARLTRQGIPNKACRQKCIFVDLYSEDFALNNVCRYAPQLLTSPKLMTLNRHRGPSTWHNYLGNLVGCTPTHTQGPTTQDLIRQLLA
ncbi:hypothetical protein QQ045_033407 [Rhodiola kirilowii]